jgi:hypothetical protein
MGFMSDTLQQIINEGVEGEEDRAQLLAETEVAAEEEFAAVADRYRETPYLAQLAVTHRARARNARHWRPRYLAAYAVSGNHTWSCDAAVVSHTTVDGHRKRDPIFAAQVLDAERRASDLLFGACFKSAVEGDCRPVFQQGVCVGYKREYDNRLRIEMLRALLPHQFKTPGAGNITVNNGPGVGAAIAITDETLRALQERRRVALERMKPGVAMVVGEPAEKRPGGF